MLLHRFVMYVPVDIVNMVGIFLTCFDFQFDQILISLSVNTIHNFLLFFHHLPIVLSFRHPLSPPNQVLNL